MLLCYMGFMIDGIIRRMSDGKIWISLKMGCKVMPEFFQSYLEALSDEHKVDLLTWIKGEDMIRQEIVEVLSEGEE